MTKNNDKIQKCFIKEEINKIGTLIIFNSKKIEGNDISLTRFEP